MKSNYKILGKFIRPVNIRNEELKATTLLGVNIDKFFMPSVANIIGTDMTAYKIIKKGQFACNRMHVGRDYRLPVAISTTSDNFLVSPAYDVFEVTNVEELLPEYLMMWLSRKEFDRNAWFYTDADVRGGLNWKAFCEMKLPVPNIDKQKEIVKEYNGLINRIKINNKIIKKLEETAQAIYKQWFVDFEFPDKNGKPYKTNGGEMEFNVELEKDIPRGWRYHNLGELMNIQGGSQPPANEFSFTPKENYIRFIQIRDYASNKNITYIRESSINKICDTEDILIARYGASLGRICYGLKGAYNVALAKVIPCESYYREFLRCYLNSKDFFDQLAGIGAGKSAREGFSKDELFLLKVPFPENSENLLKLFETHIYKIFKYKTAVDKSQKVNKKFKSILLSKIATLNN